MIESTRSYFNQINMEIETALTDKCFMQMWITVFVIAWYDGTQTQTERFSVP